MYSCLFRSVFVRLLCVCVCVCVCVGGCSLSAPATQISKQSCLDKMRKSGFEKTEQWAAHNSLSTAPNFYDFDFYVRIQNLSLFVRICACMPVCVCVFVRMCSHAWLHMWLEQTPTLVALSVCPMQTFCECVPSSSQLKHRWSDSETARETPAKVRPPPPPPPPTTRRTVKRYCISSVYSASVAHHFPVRVGLQLIVIF